MADSLFDTFSWHSCIGIDEALNGGKRFVTRIRNTASARAMFTAGGENLLVHKTTKCLWKISEDKKSIEPVFSSDVLTEKDVEAVMKED